VEIIKKEGSDMAVLIVAHDMDLVFNLADEILVLHYGEVIAKGKPEAIMKDTRVRECYMGIGNE
jgi:branched-chain amino acid transport system ATP-binding protein